MTQNWLDRFILHDQTRSQPCKFLANALSDLRCNSLLRPSDLLKPSDMAIGLTEPDYRNLTAEIWQQQLAEDIDEGNLKFSAFRPEMALSP